MKRVTKKQVRERLEWVKAQITAHPRQYDQSDYCGSACCIAGWLDIKMNGLRSHIKRGRFAAEDVEAVAVEYIGCSYRPWLFTTDFCEGPIEIESAFQEADTAKERAFVACEAIDLYMKERKV